MQFLTSLYWPCTFSQTVREQNAELRLALSLPPLYPRILSPFSLPSSVRISETHFKNAYLSRFF
jgi:hypothetical protein